MTVISQNRVLAVGQLIKFVARNIAVKELRKIYRNNVKQAAYRQLSMQLFELLLLTEYLVLELGNKNKNRIMSF